MTLKYVRKQTFSATIQLKKKLNANKLRKNSNFGLNEKRPGITNCQCLLSCTSIMYDTEISQSDLKVPKAFNADKDDASLTIFFKEAEFPTSQRTEYYSNTDFMANSGGLLGK